MNTHVFKQLVGVFVFFVVTQAGFCQPIVIWTTDGDSLTALSVKMSENISDSLIFFQKSKKRWSRLEQKEVFSLTYPDGSSQILYVPTREDDISVSRMTMFICGHSMGYKGKKSAPFFTGFAAGMISMALPPDRLFLAPIFPLTTTIVVGRVSPLKMPNFGNEDMLDGYVQRRKKQNVKYSLYGGIAGMTVGSLASFVIYGWGWK